jgi:hypothetical protein
MSDKKFYSPDQISIAAFLGGPMAGFWYMSRNANFVDDTQRAKKFNIYGVVSVILLGALSCILMKLWPGLRSESSGINVGVVVAYSSIFKTCTAKLWPAVTPDASQKGSGWKSAFTSLLFIIPTAVILIITVMMLEPVLRAI